ncbi:ribulose kinase [Phyllobacterium sp. 1468]|uniref:hypothetical protein n=1 Tax=Phyllobacterium sp. 1468 TaxID=2817759 RepID=UPI001AEA580B|nr:hypothetical protein [Phyllobacterium sp. 1468]MDR6636103.1 ribulose kinase [Phyllobacterium sp. 1468]
MEAFIGIDVGTGSARAGVFDTLWVLLGTGVTAKRFARVRTTPHSSIGSGTECIAVQKATQMAGIDPQHHRHRLRSTCSLVVAGKHGKHLPRRDTGK